MAFFNVAGYLYLIEESRRSTVIYASHEDKVLNKFRIWKERHYTHVQMTENRASRLVGWKTHPTILPRSGIELTTYLTPQLQTWSKCPKPLTTRPVSAFVLACTFFAFYRHISRSTLRGRSSIWIAGQNIVINTTFKNQANFFLRICSVFWPENNNADNGEHDLVWKKA